jgi:hypothetical protein
MVLIIEDLNEHETVKSKLPSLEEGLRYVPAIFTETLPTSQGTKADLRAIISERAERSGYSALVISSFYLEPSNVAENLEKVERWRAVCCGYTKKPIEPQ